MSTETPSTTSTHRSRPLSSWAVLITLLGLSVLGAVGTFRAERLDAQAVGAAWIAISALLWFAFGVLLVLLIVGIQRYHRRPWPLVAIALAWGGLAAIWIAGRAHLAIDTVLNNRNIDPSWTTWVTSPPIEESLKALGILLVILIPVLRRSSALDGAFIGAVVGAGFQVVENLVFTIPALETQVDDRGGALISMFFLRGVIGVLSHVVYSALIGAVIGWFVGLSGRRTARNFAVLIGACLGSVGLHALGNWGAANDAPGVYLAVSALGLVILIVVLRQARRTEDARLTEWAGGDGAAQVDAATVTVLSAGSGASRRERHRALRAVAKSEDSVLTSHQ